VPFEPGRVLRLPVSQEGVALDFTLTGLASAVVSEAFVSLCEPMLGRDEVQFIPARVEGRAETYFILNTLRTIQCIDVARSKRVVFWEPRHGVPELVGHYRYVGGMVLDVTSIGDAQMFRTWGWTMGVIISERIQRAIVSAGLVGPKFEANQGG
ncbi:MAG TPA: DUF1629 domain-containing protein, partial [Myxococcaceae bacterium]|nr:DUF1629 domain-containing protein [Myxococcaceae bacterium]